MALPSQMERSSELGRPYTARGNSGTTRTPRRQTLILGGVAAGLALVVIAVWGVSRLVAKSSGKPGPAQVAGLNVAAIQDAAEQGSMKPAPKLAPTSGPTSSPASTATPTPTPTVSSGPAAPTTPTTPPTTAPGSDTGRPAPVDVTNPGAKPPTSAPSGAGSPPSQPGAAGTGTLPAIPATGSPSEVRQLMDEGDRALAANRLVDARTVYSRVLRHPDASRGDQDSLRSKLTTINEDLVFSAKLVAGDPLAESYTVQSGDKIVSVARKRQLGVDWRLITRINKVDPSKLRVGQKIKLVRGPFHAVVDKSDYRCDIYAGSPDDPDNWLYIRSFRVGLGTNDGTPVGNFVVKKGSKLVNPHWVNPQTGQKFAADDPKNPIGEHWIGIEGLGASAAYTGFGLHGTIEPESVGQQRSMGCVRMSADDIALAYEMLVDQVSLVRIVP